MTDIAIENTLMTVEEFEEFADAPQNAEHRFELIYGEIIEKVPTEEHAVTASNISGFIWNYNRQHKLGGRVAVEPRHRVEGDNHNARLPDVAYTSASRLLPLTKKGSVPQMPDLAIEIQSPNDRPHEMREKAVYYLRNGARLVWLAYPTTKTVEVCTLNADGTLNIQVLKTEDTLTGGEVLPGFTIAVGAIFEVE